MLSARLPRFVLSYLVSISCLLTGCGNDNIRPCIDTVCAEDNEGSVVIINENSDQSDPSDVSDLSDASEPSDAADPSDDTDISDPMDATDLSDSADPATTDPTTTDAADPSAAETNCELPALSPLYGDEIEREPDSQIEQEDALVTYLADRARDRHAREDIVNGVPFQKYDHYLPFYWEQRVANLEIIDRVAAGGEGITFNFTTLAQLNPAEFRTFYANGAAVYHNNMSDFLNAGVELVSIEPSTQYPGETEYNYSAIVSQKFPDNRPLQIGDRIEIELSQFLLAPRNGRTNYYGTAVLYVVGEGVVPWYAKHREEATSDAARANASFDSFPLPAHAWLGGTTTLPYHYSNEPAHRFKQMAGNITPTSGHAFMHGRRLHHTDFQSGTHSEPGNPVFEAFQEKAGVPRVSESCVSCHLNNGRDLPPAPGALFPRAVVKLGTTVPGAPHPTLGDALQPKAAVNLNGTFLFRIEAEDYADATGIELEATTDSGGGFNVGYLDAGDALRYELGGSNALSPGSYALVLRHASQIDSGVIQVKAPERNELLTTFSVPNTGGWQSWASSTVYFQISQETQTIELYAEYGGWNLNWFEVQELEAEQSIEGSLVLEQYELLEGNYPDGEAYTLRKPIYAFSGEAAAYYSVRTAPQLIGLGLLEAIPDETLLELADPCDENNDGISGRVRAVASRTEAGKLLSGRFGYKASQPSVLYQIGVALNRDMGIASSLFPVLDGTSVPSPASSHMSADELELMRRYVSLLGVPARRDLSSESALQGEAVFTDIGCSDCHVPSLTTDARHPYAELRNQTISPYSDLLLHDLGPGLADNLNEVGASGSEWRTAPLWGIGLTRGVSGDEAYLHDGRARTLEEAILWHGGEAQTSTDAFKQLSKAERDAIIHFLESL